MIITALSSAATPSAVSGGAAERAERPAPAGAWQDLRSWLKASGCGWFELLIFIAVDVALVAFVVMLTLFTRFRAPELFEWGRHFLEAERGLIMTAVLPAGGLALLAALYFTNRGRTGWRFAALVIAALSGVAFLALSAVDLENKAYRRLLPGDSFNPDERYVAWRFGVKLPRDWNAQAAPPEPTAAADATPPAPVQREISASNGQQLFLRTCASCHGLRGEGLPGSGLELRTSAFITERGDDELVDFLKVGRQPWDADNTTGVQMPARGGDPRVTEDDLRDIVAYLRKMQDRAAPAAAPAEETPGETASPGATVGAAAAEATSAPEAQEEPDLFIVHRSYLPDAAPAPRGLSAAYLAQLARPKWAAPVEAQRYFTVYFTSSALVGLHILAALAAVAAGLWAALRRRGLTTVRSWLVMATAGWWWAAGCWLILFALLYA